MGRLVHGEILRHLCAMGACVGVRRGRGISILFAGVSFIHGDLQQKTTGRLEWIEEYHLFCAFSRTSLHPPHDIGGSGG
jgi:hypothetical protein